jgi:GDPmannose 4,6-dehydratase
MSKTACITGITGQTGSYLAELLLDEGYEVHGLVRRTSSFSTGRIEHIYDKVHLTYGDLADYSSISSWVSELKPDLFFNTAAQSHVRVSFDIPEYTMDIGATGVIRCLEAIRRHSPKTRFLQCSTSELFGSTPPPQNEQTPFHPRSPYGAAKIAGYWATVNYREAYNIFACNSVSFNHECIAEKTPIIISKNGIVDVCSAAELVPLRRKGKSIQSFELDNVAVWDGSDWTKLHAITATRRRETDPDHRMIFVEGRGGIVNSTSHHTMILSDNHEIPAGKLAVGATMKMGGLPDSLPNWTVMTEEMAEFLGLLVAEGCVSSRVQFTNQDPALLNRVSELWLRLFLGTSTSKEYPSGFENGSDVTQLSLNGCSAIGKWIKEQIYCKHSGWKKVPALVLNSPTNIKESFLEGYYAGDGLKAGNGKSVKTNSPVLAQGLCVLYSSLGSGSSVYVEHRGPRAYYQLNLLAGGKIVQHLKKDPSEVRKITEDSDPDEWVFDLETESGVFVAGIGRMVVHNSPRRGETFVTRKITRAAARIKLGLQETLTLGNLRARRDWSHAKDMAKAMYLILTARSPDDFVICSGENHSIEEFLALTFEKLDLDWREYVRFDDRYLRPSEVDALRGDATKIRTTLGWKPEYSFEQLVEEMVQHDLALAGTEKLIKDSR